MLGRPLRIDPNRHVKQVRYRYLQMTKPEIEERFLQVEQAYAELQQQLACRQFEWVERQRQEKLNLELQLEGEYDNGISATTE